MLNHMNKLWLSKLSLLRSVTLIDFLSMWQEHPKLGYLTQIHELHLLWVPVSDSAVFAPLEANLKVLTLTGESIHSWDAKFRQTLTQQILPNTKVAFSDKAFHKIM